VNVCTVRIGVILLLICQQKCLRMLLTAFRIFSV